MQDLGSGHWSALLKEVGCTTFEEACNWVQVLNYHRISDNSKLELVVKEQRGTCSTKHGLLAHLAEENGLEHVQLFVGIFLMSPATHPSLTTFFEDKPYVAIPEAHVYFKINGERLDFTGAVGVMDKIAPKIVREQRIEPHQVGEWKVKTHKKYIEQWVARNPQFNTTAEQVWEEREQCIQQFMDT